MTKKEFIDFASDNLKITKMQCLQAYDALVQEIISTANKDEKFVQPGFGSFKAIEKNERVGVNPQDKNFYKYPKKRKMKFSPSKSLKEEING